MFTDLEKKLIIKNRELNDEVELMKEINMLIISDIDRVRESLIGFQNLTDDLEDENCWLKEDICMLEETVEELRDVFNEEKLINKKQRNSMSDLENSNHKFLIKNDDLKIVNSNQRCVIERLEKESYQLCLEIDYLSGCL